MLNLWFCDLLWCLQGCVVKLSSSLSIFEQTKLAFTLLAFCTLNPSTCLKKTHFLVFTWLLDCIDMLMLNPDRGLSLPLNGKLIFTLTDPYVQLLLKDLKSMFSDMKPFILFHVSHIRHVMLILTPF